MFCVAFGHDRDRALYTAGHNQGSAIESSRARIFNLG